MAALRCMPSPVLTSGAVLARRGIAPTGAVHATGLSFAGGAAAPAAQGLLLFGARYTADPGTPSRGAPV